MRIKECYQWSGKENYFLNFADSSMSNPYGIDLEGGIVTMSFWCFPSFPNLGESFSRLDQQHIPTLNILSVGLLQWKAALSDPWLSRVCACRNRNSELIDSRGLRSSIHVQHQVIPRLFLSSQSHYDRAIMQKPHNVNEKATVRLKTQHRYHWLQSWWPQQCKKKGWKKETDKETPWTYARSSGLEEEG